MKRLAFCLLAGCGSTPDLTPDTGIDPPVTDAPVVAPLLGEVTDVVDLAACPPGAPQGATCKQVTITSCPGIETEAISATIAIRVQRGTLRGTVVHFSGGGGTGFQGGGTQAYLDAGLRTVHAAWLTDWEQTASLGIKAGGCRPATLLKWIFDEPTLHAGSRDVAFCGEGFSGGSGQLGYALAHYGIGEYLDYVNLLSGPPFGRIDLGCDGDAPATATVCGATVTTRLPQSVTAWMNISAPLQCGSTSVPADELARWQSDSIAMGGTYVYPRTEVQFYACTNRATAVTALGRQYFDAIVGAGGGTAQTSYHCYAEVDGCQGESLGNGARDATDALVASCLPRHP